MSEKPDKDAIIAELRDALIAVKPYVAHFLGGWSTHTHAQISTHALHDQITAALAYSEGRHD